MESVQNINITEEYKDQRVDNYLIRQLKGVPKSRIYRIIRKGEVRVNGSRVKPDRKLQQGDVLRIPPIRVAVRDAEGKPKDKNILKTIIYEDKFVLVIDKPWGIAVHGGSGVDFGVIEALRWSKPENEYMELVHRLDRGTSGCLMVAKKRSYLRQVHEGLRDGHSVHKSYLVVVEGVWPKRKQRVNAPLIKNVLKSGERITVVSSEGKESITEFVLLVQNDQYSLLRARPLTGRTHQIRVHCSHVGCPVVGDEKYGDAQRIKALKQLGYSRMMLHAESIVIPDSGIDSLCRFEAPVGGEMKRFIDAYCAYG